MLVVPPRAEVRHRPLDTQRLVLTPVEPADASDLWNAVDTSRAHLEKWLPWVPFNTDLDASWRYCEASASDWDHARALRFTIRERGTRRFLGVVGLESLAHLHQSAELGYWLRTDGVAPRLHDGGRAGDGRLGLQAPQCAPRPRGGGHGQLRLAGGHPPPRLSLRGDSRARPSAARAAGSTTPLFALLSTDSLSAARSSLLEATAARPLCAD